MIPTSSCKQKKQLLQYYMDVVRDQVCTRHINEATQDHWLSHPIHSSKHFAGYCKGSYNVKVLPLYSSSTLSRVHVSTCVKSV